MVVIFMGTPDYATTIFEKLITCNDIDVPLLITQPDKPVGRKQVLTPPHIKEFALKKNLEVEIYQPETLKNIEAYEKIKSHNPDFIVVAAYGQILPKNILEIAPCINLHASLLPKYRGASPIQASILNGDRFSGVTSMLMSEGLDCGDMLGFGYIELDEHIRVGELFEKLSLMAGDLTIKTLRNFDNIKPIKQFEADASYAKKITKKDGLVSFETMSSKDIYTKFRAFSPWPGIFLENGLKLIDIELVKGIGKPNRIIAIEDESVIVSCKTGALRLKNIQPKSKKVMTAAEFIRGKRLEVGSSLV